MHTGSLERDVPRLHANDPALTELLLTCTVSEQHAMRLSIALAACTTLTSLDLGYCGITEAGAAHLAEGMGRSASLATLNLGGNEIGNRGGATLGLALSVSITLASLDVSYCGITAAGAANLAQGVGRSASLAALNLSGNEIGDSGGRVVGAALAVNSSLTTLSLYYCGITAVGAAHLAEGVRQGPLRHVPLTLRGVDLGWYSVVAAVCVCARARACVRACRTKT